MITLVEPLDGVYLAMPERVVDLVIGLGDDEAKIGLAQDGGAENLVAAADLAPGERGDVVFDDVEQPVALTDF